MATKKRIHRFTITYGNIKAHSYVQQVHCGRKPNEQERSMGIKDEWIEDVHVIKHSPLLTSAVISGNTPKPLGKGMYGTSKTNQKVFEIGGQKILALNRKNAERKLARAS